jgi:hypothetical protein
MYSTSLWLLSSAIKNPGAVKELNKDTSFEEEATDKFFKYGETFAIISISAGYSVDNAPLVVAMRL